jgi:hypothetical protein
LYSVSPGEPLHSPSPNYVIGIHNNKIFMTIDKDLMEGHSKMGSRMWALQISHIAANSAADCNSTEQGENLQI